MLQSKITNNIMQHFGNSQQYQQMAENVIIQSKQDWPYVDVDVIQTQDEENEQITFQRLSTILRLPLFGKLTYLIRSNIYQDLKIVNALFILSKQMLLVERNFLIRSNKNGLWAIWLCIDGDWQLIKFDDVVPCYQKQSIVYTATLQSNLLWPLLMEKALIKIYGGKYNNLNKHIEDSVDQIINKITGLPIQQFIPENKSDTSDYIRQRLLEDQIVYVKSNQNQYFIVEEIIMGNQLGIDHIDVLCLRAENQQSIIFGQLEKIRIDQQPNMFILTFEEFMKEFQLISVVKFNHNYQFTSQILEPIYNKEHDKYLELGTIYEFSLEQNTHLYMNICQRDQNIYIPLIREPIKYGLVRVIISKKDDDNYTFISGDFDLSQNISLELFLDQGKYYVLIQGYFLKQLQSLDQQKQQTQLVLQMYGNLIPLDLKKTSNQLSFEDIFKCMVIGLAISESNPQNTRTYESQGEPNIQVTTQMNQLGLLLFYYRNFGTKILEEQIDFVLCENIVDIKTMQKQLVFNALIHPHNDQLFLFTYDPEISFQPNPVFQYKCNIKTNLQQTNPQVQSKTEKNMLRFSSGFKIRESIPRDLHRSVDVSHKNYSAADLMLYMKENGKQAKRIWLDKPVEIYLYVYQHQNGVVFLYLNYTNLQYEEKIIFQLDNLTINTKCEHQTETSVQFILDGYTHTFIYLEKIDLEKPYEFHCESIYYIN